MGNFCVPKKIVFAKINSTTSINSVNFNDSIQLPKPRMVFKSVSSDSTPFYISIKDAIMESAAYTKESQQRRFSLLSNDSILVSRHGSIAIDINDNNSTDSAPDTFSNTSFSSRTSSPIFGEGYFSCANKDNLDMKEKLTNRFIKICFTKHNHNGYQIEAINKILEYASKNNYADIIDCRNKDSNTAISVAIIENNYSLLRCLTRFIPDFPEYININNHSVPLVHVAAITEVESQETGNMLSIILRRWKEDFGYLDVALRNITAINTNSETLFEFLISQILNNSQKSRIHFENLELLFQVYKALQLQNIINETEHNEMVRICSIISINTVFWTEERRQLLTRTRQYASYTRDYLNIIFTINQRTI